MNCGAMLELILEADPEELAGQRDSVLAGHLRGCDPCRAVARQILADTKRLKSAIATRVVISPIPIDVGVSGRSRVSHRVAVAALAAATVGIAVLRGASDGVDQSSSSRRARAAVAQAPERTTQTRGAPQHVMTLLGVAPKRAAAARAARRVAARPVAAVAFPKASAVTPVRFALSNAEEGTSARVAAVAFVDPTPTKRVAILRTSDPTVTVFWFY